MMSEQLKQDGAHRQFDADGGLPITIETLQPPQPDYLLIDEITGASEEPIGVQGTIKAVRRHGKLAFIDLEGAAEVDRKLQIVVPTPAGVERDQYTGLGLKKGAVIRLNGMVAERPVDAIRADDPNPLARYEMQAAAAAIEVVARPEREAAALSWSDLREGRTAVNTENYGEILRMPEFRHVLGLREDMRAEFMHHFTQRGFRPISVPGLTGSISESGAEVFRVNTGDEREMALIQSPQQIKQIMAATEGKVVWTGQAFRNDPSRSRHHLAEFTGMDIEMQIAHDDRDAGMRHVMYELQESVRAMTNAMVDPKHAAAFAENGTLPPQVPETGIPVLNYADAMRIAGTETFNREAERAVAAYVSEHTGSDFYFVTGYPDHDKPFYTVPRDDESGGTYSFDLIYRGVEIASGGLRISDPAVLRQRLVDKGFDPADFEQYLDNFERGTAPTGGFGLGLERLVGQTLDLPVKLSTVFPKTPDTQIG